MKRPSVHRTYMAVALAISKRSTCHRREVGCVFLNEYNEIIGTGYNGVARESTHCNEVTPCAGAFLPSGTGLDKCEALHAEQNALIQCKDHHAIRTVVCTTMPCMHCVKMLANTGATHLVYEEDYPHSEQAKEYWIRKETRGVVKLDKL